MNATADGRGGSENGHGASGVDVDVIVVGGGNAALCAAISAAETGARVRLLERAPKPERGGNTCFTDGLMRVVYDGADDITALSPDLTQDELASADFGTYTEEQFFDDMARLTDYRTNPDLCEILVTRSRGTLRWMRDHGVRFRPNFGRQAYKVDGKFRFWGGATLAVADGGPGLVDSLFRAAERVGVEIVYDAWVRDLIVDASGAHGVRVRVAGGAEQDQFAGAVVLACGGFEANAEWRARYLGPGWDLAKVRGSRYNTGDGLDMAMRAGAQAFGHWSGCHATAWERNASDFGDPVKTPQFQRHSYPLGIVVNAKGERFIDEGADFRNYTYAKYGQAVLEQPGQVAWQIFDNKVEALMRDEYRTRYVTKYAADSLEGLASRLTDVDGGQLLRTIEEFNAAVAVDVPFDPNVKDGRSADGLPVPRSNWANRIDEPPFTAYEVTCGVTFTFGGLKITDQGQVVDLNGAPISGLYAAGEMVGGIFYNNYPGGSGLTSGAVFGRLSGRSAADSVARSGSVRDHATAGHQERITTP